MPNPNSVETYPPLHENSYAHRSGYSDPTQDEPAQAPVSSLARPLTLTCVKHPLAFLMRHQPKVTLNRVTVPARWNQSQTYSVPADRGIAIECKARYMGKWVAIAGTFVAPGANLVELEYGLPPIIVRPGVLGPPGSLDSTTRTMNWWNIGSIVLVIAAAATIVLTH